MASQFAHAIAHRYESRYGRRPMVFAARASAGALFSES